MEPSCPHKFVLVLTELNSFIIVYLFINAFIPLFAMDACVVLFEYGRAVNVTLFDWR